MSKYTTEKHRGFSLFNWRLATHCEILKKKRRDKYFVWNSSHSNNQKHKCIHTSLSVKDTLSRDRADSQWNSCIYTSKAFLQNTFKTTQGSIFSECSRKTSNSTTIQTGTPRQCPISMLLYNLRINFTVTLWGSWSRNSQEFYYPETPNQNKDSSTALRKVENLFSRTFSSFPAFHFPNAILSSNR